MSKKPQLRPVPVPKRNNKRTKGPLEDLFSTSPRAPPPTTAPMTTSRGGNDEYMVRVEKVFRGSDDVVKVGQTISISTPRTDGMCRVYHWIAPGRRFIMIRDSSWVNMCDMFHPPNYTSRRTEGEVLFRYVERMLAGGCEPTPIPSTEPSPTPRPTVY